MSEPTIVEILGKKYTQYWEDDEGKPPNMPPSTRVIFADKSKGTVLHQQLHCDGYETFFGNVRIIMDNGDYIHCHCWQCKRIEEND